MHTPTEQIAKYGRAIDDLILSNHTSKKGVT